MDENTNSQSSSRIRARINWALYPQTLPTTLCVGEEKTLTPGETKEVNELIGTLFLTRNRLQDLFDLAHDRFVR